MRRDYLNNPEEEKKVIKIHSDGTRWIHSGDLGYLDEDGFLYLVGRIKRMMMHGGFKVYPNIIEEVVSKHNAIEKCCAIAVPDVIYGSSPEVHIIIDDDYDNSKECLIDELKNMCLERLPEYAQPVNYVVHKELPLTAVGKIDYKSLEKQRAKELNAKD